MLAQRLKEVFDVINDELKISSLAIPAIGTGKLSQNLIDKFTWLCIFNYMIFYFKVSLIIIVLLY